MKDKYDTSNDIYTYMYLSHYFMFTQTSEKM